MITKITERVMDFSDFISEGFKIFFARIGDLSILSLGNIIPASLLLLLAQDNVLKSSDDLNVVKIVLLLVILVFYAIVGLITTMSSKIIVEGVVVDKPVSLVKAINLASSKWGRAFTTQLLSSLIIFAWSLLLFIPGFIYSIYYLFVLDAVALRDKDGQEALKYSKSLVEEQWWRIFLITLGIGVIYAIFNGTISFVFARISENPYFAIIPNAITLYGGSIFGVVSTILFLNNDFIYHRRSTRRKEIEKREKYAPTIDEYLEAKQQKKATTSKRSTVKKVQPKTEKPKTVVKRNTRKKE